MSQVPSSYESQSGFSEAWVYSSPGKKLNVHVNFNEECHPPNFFREGHKYPKHMPKKVWYPKNKNWRKKFKT